MGKEQPAFYQQCVQDELRNDLIQLQVDDEYVDHDSVQE